MFLEQISARYTVWQMEFICVYVSMYKYVEYSVRFRKNILPLSFLNKVFCVKSITQDLLSVPNKGIFFFFFLNKTPRS